MFLQCDKESLFIRIKFHYNRILIKGPSLSCEVETWIIISYGKLKIQNPLLAMSIVLGEKLNSWQSPNVLRRLHNYLKLMFGHTYKLISKYLKLTVYLNALCSFFLYVSYPTRTKTKRATRSSYHASKQFSATVKGKLFNFCSCDYLEQLTTLLWWRQLVSNNKVNRIIYWSRWKMKRWVVKVYQQLFKKLRSS